MRKILFSLALAALPVLGNAQGTSGQTVEMLYQTYKTETDLEDGKADPFYSTMQILDDPEHGTNGPDRLVAFDQLREEIAADEAAALRVLVPWLIRYIWVYPHANYTQGAWRVLRDMPLNEELLKLMAVDVLENHPHGLARAAVLEPSDGYHPWIEEPRIGALAVQLAFNDPHPDVRRNGLNHLLLQGSDPVFKRLISALETDPAAEVRAAIAEMLVRSSDAALAPFETALRQALFDPRNSAVADRILRAYLRSGPIQSDLNRLAYGLNFLAGNLDHPLVKQLHSSFGWQTDEEAVPFLLTGVPFDDGAALATFLHQHFSDETQPLKTRGHALNKLARVKSEQIAPPEILRYLMVPDHDLGSLLTVFGSYSSSPALRRLMDVPPEMLGQEYSTQLDFVTALMSHLKARQRMSDTPAAYGWGDITASSTREIMRLLNRAPQDEVQALVDVMLDHANKSPAGPLVGGLSDVLGMRKLVDRDRFLAFAEEHPHTSNLRGLGRLFVDRLKPGPWEDPAIVSGDLTAAVTLIEMIQRKTSGDAKELDFEVYELIYGLPRKEELDADLPDLPLFEAKMRELIGLATESAKFWPAKNWLGE